MIDITSKKFTLKQLQALREQIRAEIDSRTYVHPKDPSLRWLPGDTATPPRWLLVAVGNGLLNWRPNDGLDRSWLERPSRIRQARLGEAPAVADSLQD